MQLECLLAGGKALFLAGITMYCKGLAWVASPTCHRTTRTIPTCHVAIFASAMNPYSCCDKILGGKSVIQGGKGNVRPGS